MRQINPTTPIFRTTKGNIDLSKILKLNAYTTSTFSHRFPSTEPAHDHPLEADEPHDHFGGITSVVIPLPVLGPSQVLRFDEWLRTLLWENALLGDTDLARKIEVIRCKGLYTTVSGQTFLIQGVRTLYEVTLADEKTVGAGKLVLIGFLNGDIAGSLGKFLEEKLGSSLANGN